MWPQRLFAELLSNEMKLKTVKENTKNSLIDTTISATESQKGQMVTTIFSLEFTLKDGKKELCKKTYSHTDERKAE